MVIPIIMILKVVTSPIQSFDDRVSHIVTLDGTYKIDGALLLSDFHHQ